MKGERATGACIMCLSVCEGGVLCCCCACVHVRVGLLDGVGEIGGALKEGGVLEDLGRAAARAFRVLVESRTVMGLVKHFHTQN